VDGDHGDPVVEILAEGTIADPLFQIFVSGRDDPRVDGDLLGAAQPADPFFLQRAQQLDLHGRGGLGNLVQEQRAAVGDFEQSPLVRDGAGKCALLIAEQLAFQEGLGEGAAVDGDELEVLPRARLVDRPGDHLLAGAALAGEQDRAVGGRDDPDGLVDFDHLR